MSMTTYVRGFRPPDETYDKMRAVWEACEAARVTPPKEVINFFNAEKPDPAGVLVDVDAACRPWRKGTDEGIEVDLTKLDPTIKILRFVNSH